MAPASERVFFPPVEECLKGKQEVISWKLVATALSDPSGTRQTADAVSEFLKDPFVQDLVKNPNKTFAAGDDATDAEFETKTSPIHITPSSSDKYDVKAIKEDAQWLAKNAKLNRVAALRITLIELQSRPASHLIGQLSLQDELNLKDAAGENEAQSSSLAITSGAESADADTLWEKFQEEESRRLRIFSTYLSERRFFLMAANYLHSLMLQGHLPIVTAIPLDKLSQQYNLPQPLSAQDDIEGRRAFVESTMTAYLDVLAHVTEEFESSLGAITDDPIISTDEVAVEWLRTALDQAVNAASIVFQALDSMNTSMVEPTLVARWFSMMQGHSFFSAYGMHDGQAENSQSALQTVSCAISLTLLSPAKTLAHLAGDADGSGEDMLYLTSPQVMEDIHAAIWATSTNRSSAAYPTIFVWSIILLQLNLSLGERSEKRDLLLQEKSAEVLQANALRLEPTRRSSVGSIMSIEELPRDVFLRSPGIEKDAQAAESLAQLTTENGAVYDVLNQMALVAGELGDGILAPLQGSRVRRVFTDFLNWTHFSVGYQAEPVGTLLACLSGGASYWDISRQTSAAPHTDILATALHDDELMGNYLEESLNRFPFELSPFLRITTNLARCTSPSLQDTDRSELLLRLLSRTPTLTFNLPPTFQGFELAFEDENTNSFRTLEPLVLFSPRGRMRRHAAVDDFYIPEGSYGRFVTDSGRVVFMEYEHSALALLGSRLQISMNQGDYDLILGSLRPEEIAEIITLLATLIRAEHIKSPATGPGRHQKVMDIVEEASKSIDNSKDIISVVCDILDAYVQDEDTNEGHNLGVITACIQFLHAALPVLPSTILSYMARCDLLNSDSHAGKLARLTGKLEMGPDQFDFLISTVRLFSAVVDGIMGSSIRRKGLGKSSNRSSTEHNAWLGTSDNVLSKLGYSIAQATVDVFENSATWKFGSHAYPMLLMKDIVPIMRNFILYAYGLDDTGGENRPTASLEAGAEYVIDSFLSPSAGSLRFRPLLNTIHAGRENHVSTLNHTRAVTSQHQVTAVLDLATTLLRVASLHDRPVGLFEDHLFKISGLLARLCAASEHFKRPTLLLLNALVESAGRKTDEPPSLLGYLGPQLAKSFLDVLAKIDRPFSTPVEVATIWKFFSSIIRNRQQWMSNCLITGKTPREVSDAATVKDFASESVFSLALSKLKEVDALSREEALEILYFVTSAQNYWPWTVFTILKDPACFDGLRSRIRKKLSANVTAKGDPLGAAYDAKEAAYIAEAFAMQLYHLRHMGGAESAARDLLQNLDYYLRDGAAISGYNISLHSNFRKNFANKYPACSVESFKRTMLEPRDLGDNYYYNLATADKMLEFDPAWHGPRGNGFKSEMERANLNLSLVDAQISLYHAWEFLLLQINSSIPGNVNVARYMQQTALQCLEANRDGLGPENIFSRIIEHRSNFALSLIQGLINHKVQPQDVNRLLGALYGAITRIEEPFEEESAPLYRTLLKAMYIVLQAHATETDESAENGEDIPAKALVTRIQLVLNILDKIVAKGFRNLVTLIHDKNPTASPEDLGLITAILQACLAVPEMDQNQTQIINIMAAHDANHVASSLFSWSDKITGENGDPVYGELSLLFLLELSKLPLVAEQLACNGIISQIVSANLTNFMRRATISPFAENIAAQRCYSVWAKAMLPLLLNLLAAMGATVAPEISSVLCQFPALLKSSVERFEAPGTSRTVTRAESRHYVTYLTAMEMHSLALLTKVLSALRENNSRDIREVKWDGGAALEYVEFWLTSRRLLRERLLPLGQREVEWKGMSGKVEGESVLEERVVAQLEAVKDILSEEIQ